MRGRESVAVTTPQEGKNMKTRSWKVYGAEGHRQKISFGESIHWDFSNKENGIRIIDVDCEDRTNTNEYVIVHITRNNSEECEREFLAQVSDGLFEKARIGKVEEIN